MSTSKRATIYLDVSLHRALRLKSAETERSISEIVNDAVRNALSEDVDDLVAIDARRTESTRPFEEFVTELRERGDL